MKKTQCAIILVLVCLLCYFSTTTFASAYRQVGLDNFEKSLQYQANVFSDIPFSQWYYENVASVYEYGLMNGKGNSVFDPSGEITIAETIVVAVRMNYIYNFNEQFYTDDSTNSTMWYDIYVDYAKEFSVINSTYSNYNAPATRAQFAQILANSIDSIDLDEINLVDDGAIPDVNMDADYASAAYLLYRAGVLTGSDSNGTFYPDSTITRAEAAAIITRIVDPSLRKSIELVGEY